LSNTYHVRRKVTGEPKVSLIICSRKPKLIERCLDGIRERTAYAQREVVVVEHGSLGQAFGDVQVRYEGPFNFADMNNRGARAAGSEFLVFVNDDVEPIAPDWLTLLIAQLQRPEVGIAGAKLLYPSGAIQHAGIVTGIMDAAGHPLRGAFASVHWHF